VLLKYLLRIIAIGSYSPNGNVAPTRPQDDDAQLLFASLKVVPAAGHGAGGVLGPHTTHACMLVLAAADPAAADPASLHSRSLRMHTHCGWLACCLPAGDVHPA
jgi:hypothetical protein